MSTQYINDKSVSVPNTNTVLLEANLNRVAYSITNTDGAIAVSVSKGGIAIDKKGNYLYGKGSAIGESSDNVFRCWDGPISGIGDAAGPVTVSVSEVIQVD